MNEKPHRIWIPPESDLSILAIKDDAHEELSYILAAPAALAASPEVAKLIREAEARVWEQAGRAADAKAGDYPTNDADTWNQACYEISESAFKEAERIRAEAAQLRADLEAAREQIVLRDRRISELESRDGIILITTKEEHDAALASAPAQNGGDAT